MALLRRYLREPVNAILHLVGSILALGGLLVLLAVSYGQPGKMLSLLVYGSSLVALFGASTLLHGWKAGPRLHDWLNRLDHMAIFLLIAGTYTPIVANLFPQRWRLPVLAGVWAVAGAGMAHKLLSARIHGFFHVSIYVLLGWGGALPLALLLPLAPRLTAGGLGLLILGGLIFTMGFVIYYARRPDPWPGVLGHHEIWHLFVLGGSLCHYLFMLWYVAPAAAAG